MAVEHELRDGTLTSDPRLDRLVDFDERSRNFPVRSLLGAAPIKGKTWLLNARLNQGREGACTGFSRAHDLAASPQMAKGISSDVAQAIYRRAKYLDPWPGEDYEGSSVLAACKAAQELGYIGEYRWAFGIDDMLGAIANLGGTVQGTDWLDDMFEPRPSGLLDVSGEVMGGHAYYARGVIVHRDTMRRALGKGEKLRNEPLVRITNSWGPAWGKNGECFIWASDMERLLKGIRFPGESCIVTSAFRKG